METTTATTAAAAAAAAAEDYTLSGGEVGKGVVVKEEAELAKKDVVFAAKDEKDEFLETKEDELAEKDAILATKDEKDGELGKKDEFLEAEEGGLVNKEATLDTEDERDEFLDTEDDDLGKTEASLASKDEKAEILDAEESEKVEKEAPLLSQDEPEVTSEPVSVPVNVNSVAGSELGSGSNGSVVANKGLGVSVSNENSVVGVDEEGKKDEGLSREIGENTVEKPISSDSVNLANEGEVFDEITETSKGVGVEGFVNGQKDKEVEHDGDGVDSREVLAAAASLPAASEEAVEKEKDGEVVVDKELEEKRVDGSFIGEEDGKSGGNGAVLVADDEDDDDEDAGGNELGDEEDEGLSSDGPARVAILESPEAAKQIMKELEGGSSSGGAFSGLGGSREFPQSMDGQIVLDSDEELDDDDDNDEGDEKEVFDSAALAALLKAATGSSGPDGNITVTAQDGTRIFAMDRPAGLGSSVPSLRPAAPRQAPRSNLFGSSDVVVTDPVEDMTEEEKQLHDKVELIRVKFLRLVYRLGQSPEETVAAQVLYRLSLAEGIRRGRQTNRAFSLENARNKALQLEVGWKDHDINFSCNILVLGKTGVGKSATINSIFGEEKSVTDAFQTATTGVREIVGIVDGVKIRIIDTPGLTASVMDQSANRRILSSVQKYTKRCPPDIVLYVDRMDTQTRDLNDLPLLRTITATLGSSIWFNAIVALTHAASAPPDGPNGSPITYEVFVAQRSHIVQQAIRQAAGDMRLMNPVALVENHPSCRRNREGQKVLPNGLSWRHQMLLLCYSSKILSEANALLKLQDPSPGKLFGYRLRSPPLPYLLSSLLQSRAHPKLSADQGGDNGDSDIELDDFSDAEQEEEEDEYDQLPPFKPLKKAQLEKLTKEQRNAYFDEYEYRVKLLQKKQWKEELRRLKEMKKKGKSSNQAPDAFAYGDMGEEYDQDAAPATVPVPLPDMVLPPSFECDAPTYRYRFLEPTSTLLARPVLDTHGWDHDCGYDGVSVEETLAIVGKFPSVVAVQVTKDKKEFSLHLDSSVSAKHGENGSSLAGFDIQTVGRQLAYILRGETKFKNLKKNKTTGGFSVTFLGDVVATGLKVEDQLSIGKRVQLVASTGAMRAQGDTAYGANLEARLKDKDYPIGQSLSTFGLSLMKWHGDLALGANLQSQFPIGRGSKMSVRLGLNNKLSGQITVKTSSSEQLQIALLGVIPLAVSIYNSFRPSEPYAY